MATPRADLLVPAARPHSNSICTGLLSPNPHQSSRAQTHRASDGQLFNSNTMRRESHRISVQDEFYYYTLPKRRFSTIFTTVWASYLFLFLAVLITFSIVFAVGYLLNSMVVKELPSSHANHTSSDARSSQRKFGIDDGIVTVERVRDVYRKRGDAEETKLGKPYTTTFLLLTTS